MGCLASTAAGDPAGVPVFAALPAPFNSRVDAVLSRFQGGSDECHFIFSGDQVIEYTTWSYAKTPVKAPPMPIASHSIFGRLPAPFNTKIDAVLTKPGGNGSSSECHYVFSGDQVMEITTWSHAKTPVKAPPMPIASHSIFGRLPAPFNTKIDAVLSKQNGGEQSGSGECHIALSGDLAMEITTWTYDKTPVKKAPMPIANHSIFGRLPMPFNTKVDAVLSKASNAGSAECHYIFSGDQVMAVTTWSHAPSPLKVAPTKIDGAALLQS